MKARQVLRTALRALLGALLSVIALGAAALASLWAWSGTQASLDWAWQRYALPRGLTAEGLSGSLRSGLRARRIQAQAGRLHLELHDVAVTWDLLALLDEQVRITGVRAARLQLRAPPGLGPALQRAPPSSLALPLAVRVDHLSLDRLEWTGLVPFEASHLAAAYRYELAGGGHRLTLFDANVASGRYHGEAALADRAPLALDAWLRGDVRVHPDGAARPLRLAAHARVRGTLTRFTLEAGLRPERETRPRPGGRPERGAASRPAAPTARLEARVMPWQAPFVPQARLHLQAVDLAALWPQAPRTGLDGRVDLAPWRDGGWRLAADLRNDRPGPWDRQGLPFARVQGEGTWHEGLARMRRLHARLGERDGAGEVTGHGRWQASGDAHLDLRLAGVQAQALHSALRAGTVHAPQAFEGRAQARTASGLTRFELALRALPATARAPSGAPATGAALAIAALGAQGRWQAGHLQVQARAQGQVRVGRQALDFTMAGEARRDADAHPVWQGRIEQARVALPAPGADAGAWRLQLQAPVDLRAELAPGLTRWTLNAGRAWLNAPAARASPPAVVAWDTARWGGGELHGAGRIHGLPLAWWPLTGPAAPGNDLVFDAHWDVHLARTLRITASLARVQGDLTLLAQTAEGTPVRVAAGVREARLSLRAEGEALRMSLRWASERAGTLQGELSTRLAAGGRLGWRWPADAPVAGRVQARLPRIAAWSALAPPGWRLRGSLAADITLTGTRGAPRLSGPLRADDVSLRSVVDGIALEDGRLRAHLDHPRLVIDEWVWQTGPGPDGRPGSLRARGEARWADAAPGQPAGVSARLDAQLDRLQASVRSDRQVTVSGTVSAWLSPAQLALEGDLRVDRARVRVSDAPAPRLGEDVRVRHLPGGLASPWAEAAAGAGSARRALRLEVDVDLGRDFRVSGRGVYTGVQGVVRVSGDSLAQPRLTGTVHAVEGHYTAYGQRLDLRRGVLRFTGPHDDPALDVIAVRSDLERPVGVQITGRAQAPVLRLWSQEPATEAEKLSWLVLGRGAAAGSGETVLLEQAALSLLARRAGLGRRGIAAAFGLDEFTLRREGEQGAALTLGKRLGRRLYAAYERGLSGALGTLYVFYDLTARLSLRAQAGDRTGLDLVYALSFDRPDAPVPAGQVQGGPPR